MSARTEPRWFFLLSMEYTREQKDAMLRKLRDNNLISSTASDERERKIWQEAFDMYNSARGTTLNDTTCNKCCEVVRDWLNK